MQQLHHPNLLVVGSVALDTVQTPAGEVKEALGGAAVYSSVSASFFEPPMLVGVVGADFPQEHTEFLKLRGIDLRGLKTADGRTFRWKGYYDLDVNQAHSLDTQLNVFADFEPRLPESYRAAEFVFLANIDPELQLQVLDQVTTPRLTMCDTMNFWIESKREALVEVLQRVDVAVMNDAEARQLCGTFSLVAAARRIREWGPSTVIIKKGEHGAVMFTEAAHFSAPSYPLDEVRDPTGAGDTFAGGFIGYVASTGDVGEPNLRKGIIYGSAMASFAVEEFSLDRMRRLTREEIEERYEQFRRIAFF